MNVYDLDATRPPGDVRSWPLRTGADAVMLERIASKISICPETGCWEFFGTRSPRGYGRIGVNRRMVVVHRVLYELLIADVPDGLQLDHLCNNPPCCYPGHLEPVTPSENMLRSFQRGRDRGLKPVKHGTRSGYDAHRRRGETPCDECRAGAAAYVKSTRIKRVARQTPPSADVLERVMPAAECDDDFATAYFRTLRPIPTPAGESFRPDFHEDQP